MKKTLFSLIALMSVMTVQAQSICATWRTMQPVVITDADGSFSAQNVTYTFYEDGTYSFADELTQATQPAKTMALEVATNIELKGTYKLEGDQLTLTPNMDTYKTELLNISMNGHVTDDANIKAQVTQMLNSDEFKSQFAEGPLPIHKCIRYTDMALGRFFDAASRQPWFKNTIFVLTSDHTNMSDHPEYQTDLGGFASPIIIYDPSGELIQPGMENKVAQQIDILPTLMSLLGYPKPYIAFGKDVLNTPAPQTWAVNYLNGIYQLVQGGWILQFDGNKTTGFYRLDDRLMKQNLMGTAPEQQAQMEQFLKAIIQQYMQRMTHDQLTIQN